MIKLDLNPPKDQLYQFGTVALVGFTLAISSMVERKTHALAGIFGSMFLLHSIGRVTENLMEDDRWTLFSLFDTFSVLANWVFDQHGRIEFDHRLGIGCVAFWLVGTLVVVFRRVRKLEVVA